MKKNPKYLIALLFLLVSLGVFLFLTIPTEEKFLKCIVDEMRGQNEEMRRTVIGYCELKTGYKR